MSFSDERRAIENRFRTEWQKVSSLLIEYDGVPFPPDDEQRDLSAWVGISIVPSDTPEILEIGPNPSIRYTGVIQNAVHTEAGMGTDYARQLADLAATIWENAVFSVGQSGEIVCEAPGIAPAMMGGDGELVIVVSTVYRRSLWTKMPRPEGGTEPMPAGKPRWYVPVLIEDGNNNRFSVTPPPDPVTSLVTKNSRVLAWHLDYEWSVDGVVTLTEAVNPLDDVVRVYA